MANESSLDLSVELLVQGLIGLLVLLWALKDAVPAYRAMRAASKSADPMVAAMSISWDRDQQERLLQLMERIAKANEVQAERQTALADQQRVDLNDKIDVLMEELRRKEREVKDLHALRSPRRR